MCKKLILWCPSCALFSFKLKCVGDLGSGPHIYKEFYDKRTSIYSDCHITLQHYDTNHICKKLKWQYKKTERKKAVVEVEHWKCDIKFITQSTIFKEKIRHFLSQHNKILWRRKLNHGVSLFNHCCRYFCNSRYRIPFNKEQLKSPQQEELLRV